MSRKLVMQGMFKPWEPSKILLKNTVLMGRCIAHNVEKEAKVRVFRNMFDDNLNAFFRHFTDIFAHDPTRECKVGDLVLIRKLQERLSLEVGHEVTRVLYPYGDIKDPITGKMVSSSYYRDEMKIVNEMFGKAADSAEGFDYDKAPPRGWQEGKRDFTHMEGYHKYHEFEPGHPLYEDNAASDI